MTSEVLKVRQKIWTKGKVLLPAALQLSFRTVVKAHVHSLKEPEAVTCWQPYTELTWVLEATSPNLTSLVTTPISYWCIQVNTFLFLFTINLWIFGILEQILPKGCQKAAFITENRLIFFFQGINYSCLRIVTTTEETDKNKSLTNWIHQGYLPGTICTMYVFQNVIHI